MDYRVNYLWIDKSISIRMIDAGGRESLAMLGAEMGQSSPPETNAERYLRRARALREMARNASSEEVQRELVVVAQQYEKLAEDVRRLERKR